MKKLNIIIILLIQINLIFLVLNFYKGNDYNDKVYMCYANIDDEIKVIKIELDDDYFVSKVTTYYNQLNRKNFKETLNSSTEFYNKIKKEFINQKIYFTKTKTYDENLYLEKLMENYSDYRCSYELKK
jgi:hypothetical protein